VLAFSRGTEPTECNYKRRVIRLAYSERLGSSTMAICKIENWRNPQLLILRTWKLQTKRD
jgi:hypothetical protein